MKKEKHILINNIHRYFGVQFNNTAFDYFDKKNRTQEEIEDMINYAHSSLHHYFPAAQLLMYKEGSI